MNWKWVILTRAETMFVKRISCLAFSRHEKGCIKVSFHSFNIYSFFQRLPVSRTEKANSNNMTATFELYGDFMCKPFGNTIFLYSYKIKTPYEKKNILFICQLQSLTIKSWFTHLQALDIYAVFLYVSVYVNTCLDNIFPIQTHIKNWIMNTWFKLQWDTNIFQLKRFNWHLHLFSKIWATTLQ